MAASPKLHVPEHPVRFVTAASLFDGHDASINIMRRILQSQGAEVVHLGHNRSVDEVVDAAISEDVQGVAVSSYQGGHIEYFSYLVELLARARGRPRPGVRRRGRRDRPGRDRRLCDAWRADLLAGGRPAPRPGRDGQHDDRRLRRRPLRRRGPSSWRRPAGRRPATLARAITVLEAGRLPDERAQPVDAATATRRVPVLGITGTGGSGKSSLTDELLRRFRLDQADKVRVAVIAIDPTRRRGGGALLGDRIRMNRIDGRGCSLRLLPVAGDPRGQAGGCPSTSTTRSRRCKAAGYDLVDRGDARHRPG